MLVIIYLIISYIILFYFVFSMKPFFGIVLVAYVIDMFWTWNCCYLWFSFYLLLRYRGILKLSWKLSQHMITSKKSNFLHLWTFNFYLPHYTLVLWSLYCFLPSWSKSFPFSIFPVCLPDIFFWFFNLWFCFMVLLSRRN